MSEYAAPGLADEIRNATVPAGAAAIWWLGQASFALKGGGATVYVDPYLQVSDRRMSPPPFAPSAIDHADIVVVTHDHLDHVDPNTLPGIAAASSATRFVAPRPIAGRVAELVGSADRVFSALADVPMRLTTPGGTVELLPTPAKHEEFNETPEGYPYLGYTIRLGDVTIHHSGDTIPYEGQIERVRAHAVDVALLPINGRDFYRTRRGILGNFDYREAADFAAAIDAKLVVPMHYGMFAANTVPPGHFVSYLAEQYPHVAAHVMGRFGRLVYTRP
ncbi:MAG: MBL fold metallo-hydrolase [Chloroflexota bacterium]|nr:MAG: MBL fold metallo-hydrolase [Chloroflexota bacterium]